MGMSAISAPQSTQTVLGATRNSLNELHTLVVHKFVEKSRNNRRFSPHFSTKVSHPSKFSPASGDVWRKMCVMVNYLYLDLFVHLL